MPSRPIRPSDQAESADSFGERGCGCDRSEPHVHYFGSYEPLVPPVSEPVGPEDLAPPLGPGEVDVWLTGWQVDEDGLEFAVGDDVSWQLVPVEEGWPSRILGDGRSVALRLDTNAEATRDRTDPSAWTMVSGRIVRLDQVSRRQVASEGAGRNDKGNDGRDDGRDGGGNDGRDGGDDGVVLADRDVGMQHTVRSLSERRPHGIDVAGWVVRVSIARR